MDTNGLNQLAFPSCARDCHLPIVIVNENGKLQARCCQEIKTPDPINNYIFGYYMAHMERNNKMSSSYSWSCREMLTAC